MLVIVSSGKQSIGQNAYCTTDKQEFISQTLYSDPNSPSIPHSFKQILHQRIDRQLHLILYHLHLTITSSTHSTPVLILQKEDKNYQYVQILCFLSQSSHSTPPIRPWFQDRHPGKKKQTFFNTPLTHRNCILFHSTL